MTSTGVPEVFSDSQGRAPIELDVYGFAVAVATSSAAALLVVSAAFAIGDDASDFARLTGLAIVTGAIAFALNRCPVSDRPLRPVPTLASAVVAYGVLGVISTVVYLVTGALDRPDDALYESFAGVSTSALTLFEDPAVLGDGLLIWRSGTQWLGGMGALALAVGLLPFLGGSRELADPRGRPATGTFAPRPTPALRRVAVIYGSASSGVFIAFLVVGMGLRDAVAHAFSSVSTGGFSTHADSIAYFDSVAIEMAVIVAMAGAGSSVALVWMLYRRQFSDTRRAFELRIYVAVLAGATLWVWWLNRDIQSGTGRGLREALFTVVSLTTTTGHRIGDWGAWHPGAVTVLLILVGIGGMAGSVAGGLRWIRVIGLTQFIWRELQRQLHPRSIRTVKVGTDTISEASVDRMHAQLVFTMTVGTGGALLLALLGSEIMQALTLAVSAVSTAGPALSHSGGTITTAAELSRPERLTLLPLMLAGRVFLYPAFVLAGAGFFAASRALARRRGSFVRGRVGSGR